MRSRRGAGGSLRCQNSSRGPFPHFQIIQLVDTPRDTFKGDHQVDVKWLPSLPQSADLNNTGLFMERPGVQGAKWISTPFIPQSFPSSKKEGKHPITYSPQLGRQRSMRDWTSSEGRSYFLIRHLMFKHC